MCSSQFRLGFLDGIRDRQRQSKRNIEKMRRVKHAEYMRGYAAGYEAPAGINQDAEKGNKK